MIDKSEKFTGSLGRPSLFLPTPGGPSGLQVEPQTKPGLYVDRSFLRVWRSFADFSFSGMNCVKHHCVRRVHRVAAKALPNGTLSTEKVQIGQVLSEFKLQIRSFWKEPVDED